MATIAQLLVKLSGDNTDLRRSLTDSAERAQSFVRTVQQASQNARFKVDTTSLNETNSTILRLEQRIKGVIETSHGLKDLTTGRFVGPEVVSNLQNVIKKYEELAVVQELAADRASKPLQNNAALAAADALVTEMKTALSAGSAEIKAAAIKGLMTPQEATRAAQLAALAYNETLTRVIADLSASGSLTAELDTKLTAAMSKEGTQAGLAFDRSMAASMKANGNQVVGAAEQVAEKSKFALTAAEGAFTTFGRRGATALVGLGFGIESFANGTEGGMRRALRSVETFAIFGFGQYGLLAAGIITAGLAIFDFFRKAEKRAEESAKRLAQIISGLANSNDNFDLVKNLKDFQQGQRTEVVDDKLVIHKQSQFARGAFEDSPADLESRLRAQNQLVIDAKHNGNIFLAAKLQREADALENRLQPLRVRAKEIIDLINSPGDLLHESEKPPPFVIKAKTGTTPRNCGMKRVHCW